MERNASICKLEQWKNDYNAQETNLSFLIYRWKYKRKFFTQNHISTNHGYLRQHQNISIQIFIKITINVLYVKMCLIIPNVLHSFLLLSIIVHSNMLFHMIVYDWVAIEPLDLRQGTGVKVALLTFALLTIYGGWAIKIGVT